MADYERDSRFGQYVIELAIREAQLPRRIDRVFESRILKWNGRCPFVAKYSVVWKDPGCRRVKSLEERLMVVENRLGIPWWIVTIGPWM